MFSPLCIRWCSFNAASVKLPFPPHTKRCVCWLDLPDVEALLEDLTRVWRQDSGEQRHCVQRYEKKPKIRKACLIMNWAVSGVHFLEIQFSGSQRLSNLSINSWAILYRVKEWELLELYTLQDTHLALHPSWVPLKCHLTPSQFARTH